MDELQYEVPFFIGALTLISAVLIALFFQSWVVVIILGILYTLNSLQVILWRIKLGKTAFIKNIYPPPQSGKAGEYASEFYLLVFTTFAPGLILVHTADAILCIANLLHRPISY